MLTACLCSAPQQVWDRDVNAALNIMRIVLWQHGRTLKDRPPDLVRRDRGWWAAQRRAEEAVLPFVCVGLPALEAAGSPAAAGEAVRRAAQQVLDSLPRGKRICITATRGQPSAWLPQWL